MRNLIATAAMALAAPALMFGAMPANAASTFGKAPKAEAASHTESAWEHSRKKDRRYYRSYAPRSYYQPRGYYGEPVSYRTRAWRGDDGRYYCKRSNGTTGLLIGAAGGALLGREVAGRYGDRTLGAILGAAGGALLGRSIDRSSSRCQ